MKQFNIIYLRDGSMLLSKKEYAEWNEIQAEYDNYMASLDFESIEIVKDYIFFEYDIKAAKLTELIAPLVNNEEEVVKLEW